jgi:hypothetical protein
MAHRMAYDEDSGQLVMFGGCTGGCTVLDGDVATPTVNDTFTLTTGSWSNALPNIPISARCCVGMAYASTSPFTGHPKGIFLFGGADSNDVRLGDMWFWNGTSWCQVSGTHCT